MNKSVHMRCGRLIAVAGATALSLLVFTACGGSGAQETSAVDGGGLGTAAAHVKITMMANDAFAQQWQDKLVPEFNKEFPYIDVIIDSVPYTELLAKGMLNGTDPDPQYDPNP